MRIGSLGRPADGRLSVLAPLLLLFSVAARLAWTYLVPNGANFVDLHVYLGGAATLDVPGTLYSYVYADQTPDFPLPFTYPPFAALVFYPLSRLPFGLVAAVLATGHHRGPLRCGPAQPATARTFGGLSAHGDGVDGDRNLD